MAGRRKTIDLSVAHGGIHEEARVNVLNSTKEHEIVDLNGFVMKRRKTIVEDPATAAADGGGTQASLLQTPYEQQERGSVATQRTPNVEEYEISAELYERLSHNLHNLPETAGPSDRLLALCGSVCAAELEILRKGGKLEDVAVLEIVFSSFLEALKAAAEGGDLQFAAVSSGSPEMGDEDLRVDLEARKAGLKNRLQILNKEEQEWHDLLNKVEELDMGDAGISEDDNAGPTTTAAAGEKYAAAEIAALKAIQQDVHRKITMQVDGVCTLVGNIEDLIDRANQTAQDVHVQHRKKRFENFPHIDSPKFLIKKLMAPDGQ